jgi:hypothetical protein
MPGTVTRTPAKRALADATNNRANVLASPRSAKKLKLDNGKGRTGPPVKTTNGSFNSSQPAPSQFEQTLEKMTQDMETLKENNTEKDQQWRRPPLPADFNDMSQKLVFQQIEAEEGVLNGGRPTVKLFGVTEVCTAQRACVSALTVVRRMATPSSSTSQASCTTSTSPRPLASSNTTAMHTRSTSRASARSSSTSTRLSSIRYR